MRDIILASVKYLEIRKPYKIILKAKVKGAQAWHTGLYRKNKLIGHRIEVTLDIDKFRDCETLIVHEFIHAWQSENGFTDTHGESFQRKAADIEMIFGIKNLYIAGTDI